MKQSLHLFLLGLFILPMIGWVYTTFSKKYRGTKIQNVFGIISMAIYIAILTLNYFKF